MKKSIAVEFDAIIGIFKQQQKFIRNLFFTLCFFSGNPTFRNHYRHSGYCEKTYSRKYRKPFDFTQFNNHILTNSLLQKTNLAVVIYSYFTEKISKLLNSPFLNVGIIKKWK